MRFLRLAASLLVLSAAPIAACEADPGAEFSACGEEDCGADEVCIRSSPECHDEDVDGGSSDARCGARPETCSSDGPPVCGADGRVYDSACLAHRDGIPTAGGGGSCDPPEGTFQCGEAFCDVASEACVTQFSDCDDIPFAECMPRPAECAEDDCACIFDGVCWSSFRDEDQCYRPEGGGLDISC
jgi:hypothetical protein